jgi:hypothetical protein
MAITLLPREARTQPPCWMTQHDSRARQMLRISFGPWQLATATHRETPSNYLCTNDEEEIGGAIPNRLRGRACRTGLLTHHHHEQQTQEFRRRLVSRNLFWCDAPPVLEKHGGQQPGVRESCENACGDAQLRVGWPCPPPTSTRRCVDLQHAYRSPGLSHGEHANQVRGSRTMSGISRLVRC